MDDLKEADERDLNTSPTPKIPASSPPSSGGGLVVWTAAAGGLALLLLVVHALLPYARPVRVVDRAIAALQAGDTALLASEERLGWKALAESESRRRGEVEYARVIGLFDKAAALGDRQYRGLRRKLFDLGDREVRRLPRDDQKTLRELGRRQFVADKGWASLGEEDQKTIGSPDVLGDKQKIRARAIALGLPLLPQDVQLSVTGLDLTAPALAKDKKLGKIVAQAEKAGLAELAPSVQAAEQAAAAELAKLARPKRERIELGPYLKFVFTEGLKATDEKTRQKATLEQLVDDDAPTAWALRRSFGIKDLDAESRKQIEGLDYDAFVAGRRAFVEKEGRRLWSVKLKETFNPDCCSTGKVHYLGESARSLLRNDAATVALAFGPLPPKPKKDADKKDGDKKDGDDGKAAKATVEDEPEDGVHPAKRLLGSELKLSYAWGSWTLTGFARGSSDEARSRAPLEAMKGALALAGIASHSTVSGFFLLVALGVAVFWLIVGRRPRSETSGALLPVELGAAAAVLVLASLQIAFEGQVSLDDCWFTPLYLALPIWVGLRGDGESGVVAGLLMGLALVVASAVAGVPSWLQVGDALPLGEHLLATLVFVGTAVVASRLRGAAEPRVVALALPLSWLLFYAAIDRGQLAALTAYAHVLLGAAVAGAGLLVAKAGLFGRLKEARRAPAPLEPLEP